MASVSVDEILQFIVASGGRVTNRELVKHFRKYLTNPATKEQARVQFKEYVNQIAITRTENNEKYVILRKKYTENPSNGASNGTQSVISPASKRQPPPYRPPPQVVSPSPSIADTISIRDDISFDSVSQSSYVMDHEQENKSARQNDATVPTVPPRRRSQDPANDADNDAGKHEVPDNEKISVKERTKKFNRLASVTDVRPVVSPNSKKKADKVKDEEDGPVQVSALDAKSREWMVKASISDYHELAKLAAENPQLPRFRDPITTVLHWAAKHGNQNVIKLMAGTYGVNVNTKTGYTPLHIAMQFGHENIHDLLVKVYHADADIRDWSGRLPRSYLPNMNAPNSTQTYRKMKSRRKHSEKETGFLRIGSLNVRVKKTTEAFSNFLSGNSDKVYKTWSSADSLQKAPGPRTQLKKKKSKRSQDFAINHSQSTPGTPGSQRANSAICPKSADLKDSDSDTACGFDSDWHKNLE